MSYINFGLLEKKDVTPTEYLILQCCKQMRVEDISGYLERICETEEPILSLEDRGFVTFVKGKSKDSFFKKARLTEAGNNLLALIETPMITEEDIVVWDWLANVYKKHGKDVGNAKNGKVWLASFRAHSGIDKNKLITLCLAFIKDENQMEYSKRLDYVFFKGENIFSVKFDLESSKLWRYYCKNKQAFDERFKLIDAQNKD